MYFTKLVNKCLSRQTYEKLYHIRYPNEDVWGKTRQVVVDSQSVVFALSAAVDEIFTRKLTNTGMRFGVLTPAIYTKSHCVNSFQQDIIHVRVSFSRSVETHHDKSRPVAFKECSCPLFNEHKQIVNKKNSKQQGRKRQGACLSIGGFCPHCNIVFEALGCF